MKIDIHNHYHHHPDPAVQDGLRSILGKLAKMSAAFDRLSQEVTETKTAVGSVLALVDGLADQIRELKDDPAKLEELANTLDAQQQLIAAKVLENTPAAPPADPAPADATPTDGSTTPAG
jgi:chromosome segregation ATPase